MKATKSKEKQLELKGRWLTLEAANSNEPLSGKRARQLITLRRQFGYSYGMKSESVN